MIFRSSRTKESDATEANESAIHAGEARDASARRRSCDHACPRRLADCSRGRDVAAAAPRPPRWGGENRRATPVELSESVPPGQFGYLT